MNILHILSNYKWTERAEPAADLAVAQKSAGARVFFACGVNRRLHEEDSVAFRLRDRGLHPDIFNLTKHFRMTPALSDILALSRYINEREIDVVHCHMPNAHLIGAVSARRSQRRPLVVRTLYNPDRDEQPLRLKLACRIGTDGIIAISRPAQVWLTAVLQWPETRTRIIEPGINLERFRTVPAGGDLRSESGFARDDFVIGMVTAIGPRRRLDITLGALKLLADRHPRLRFLLVGRGKIKRIVDDPAHALGIRDRIVLAGYCRGERLVRAYRTMDLLVYPMPGTDKSCRTVREAMAAGIPVAASRIGFLPHLVTDGITGRLMEPEPQALANIIEELTTRPDLLTAMGAAAAQAALHRFAPQRQAEKTLEFYADLLRAKISR